MELGNAFGKEKSHSFRSRQFPRRANVESLGSHSAIPILDMQERLSAFKRIHGQNISFFEGDLLDYDFLADVVKQTHPDAIVHLAEQPSALLA